MTYVRFIVLAAFFATSGIFFGCATVIPPEFAATGNGSVLPGPILALAGEGEVLVAANPEGVYRRKDNSSWEKLEIPGIDDYQIVSALAVQGEEICVGTDGEGLHILSGGVWEIRAARYGGLPDGHVLSLAYDGDRDGFPGNNLWVGTEKGITVRSKGEWTVYEPGKKWLSDMAERVPGGAGSTYLASGYKLGAKGEDSEFFKPPVTAIGVGPGRVVFGNRDSHIAIVGPEGFATVHISEPIRISSLLVEENVIWAGTNEGLMWGGLSGKAEGTPWPSHSNSIFWTGRLFDTKDGRPFLYRWHLVGYNTGKVLALARGGDSLWVSFGKPEEKAATSSNKDDDATKSIPGLRRYPSIDDYIVRKDKFVYESYGKKTGIQGDATSVAALSESGEIWVGTTKGLFLLER